jgi:uncharacterized protein YjiS (DUF1127 family)
MELEMSTPQYYGSIGILNVPYFDPTPRQSRLLGWMSCARNACFQRLGDWQERAWSRRRLAQLDDRLLADIGLGYADVDTERAKPFWRL